MHLKLLINECRNIITTLENQLVTLKELLRKNCSLDDLNYYNDKLTSMAHSLESLLSYRRQRKLNISIQPTRNNSSERSLITTAEVNNNVRTATPLTKLGVLKILNIVHP